MASPPSSSPSDDNSSAAQAHSVPLVPADCLACKLIGVGAFSGLGIYSLMLAKADGAFAKRRPMGKSLVAGRIQAVLGLGFLLAGVSRLAW